MLHSSASVGQHYLTKRTLGDPIAHVGKLPKFNVEFVAANDIVTSKRSVSDETIRAMWNGVMAKDPATLSLKVECTEAQTCLWGNYSTIALDYECENITSSITRTCDDKSIRNCTFMLPLTQLTLHNYEELYISQEYLPAPFSNHRAGALAAWQMMGLPRSKDNVTALAA